ncbi:hypothetical protein [Paludibacterium paludis]|uniref:Uncharacterized protein n=1 Tax=Paludibacterium paludis TaxID=1225769 RepID=A0A918P1A5_9NEIS|nr:hypothetical protein [Paludibacterium paludis]GGY12191.1 hypothetical protein GCM10011289_14120 [Paludibacterium paludis]
MTDVVMAEAFNPARVGAGSVFGWLSRGWALYRVRPLFWTLPWLAMTVLSMLCGLAVPLLGMVAWLFLQMAFAAGVASCACKSEHGEPVAVGSLFVGFRASGRSIGMLALLMTGLYLVIALLVLALGFIFQVYTTMLVFVFMALFVILFLGKWICMLAPILVEMQGYLPFNAFKGAARAVRINWLAFLVLDLVYFLLFGVIYEAGGAAIPGSLWGFASVLFAMLVLCPLYCLISYAAWREVFPE